MNRALAIAAATLLFAPSLATSQVVTLPPTCAPGSFVSATGPKLWMYVGSSCADLSQLFIAGTGGTYSMRTGLLSFFGSTFQLNVTYDTDPFITFGITTSNFGVTSTPYAFQFLTPIVPGAYNNATSTGSVSVTNGVGPGNLTNTTASVTTSAMYPNFISGFGVVGVNPLNLGVDIGTMPCSASGAAASVTTTCGFGPGASTFAPTAYNGLEATLTYNQSGLGSAASFSGTVTLNAITAGTTVPEPATFVLLAAGLAVLGGALTRKRNSDNLQG